MDASLRELRPWVDASRAGALEHRVAWATRRVDAACSALHGSERSAALDALERRAQRGVATRAPRSVDDVEASMDGQRALAGATAEERARVVALVARSAAARAAAAAALERRSAVAEESERYAAVESARGAFDRALQALAAAQLACRAHAQLAATLERTDYHVAECIYLDAERRLGEAQERYGAVTLALEQNVGLLHGMWRITESGRDVVCAVSPEAASRARGGGTGR